VCAPTARTVIAVTVTRTKDAATVLSPNGKAFPVTFLGGERAEVDVAASVAYSQHVDRLRRHHAGCEVGDITAEGGPQRSGMRTAMCWSPARRSLSQRCGVVPDDGVPFAATISHYDRPR
jgi:hypothetical protein